MSKKDRKYVFIPIKPETRDKLIKLKVYGSTYNSVIDMLLVNYQEDMIENLGHQNIDHEEK